MGSPFKVRRGQSIEFQVRVAKVAGGKIEVIRDGAAVDKIASSAVTSDDYSMSFTQRVDSARHWVRVNVRDANGRIVLIGNPIYINY